MLPTLQGSAPVKREDLQRSDSLMETSLGLWSCKDMKWASEHAVQFPQTSFCLQLEAHEDEIHL